MLMIKRPFFGRIAQTIDPATARPYFHYWIGRSGVIMFDGAAGDEAEAVETVNVHLSRLTKRENGDHLPRRHPRRLGCSHLRRQSNNDARFSP